MTGPLVSAVVPAHDAAAHIREAPESVASQKGPFGVEILVVDDGSTDDTAREVESFGAARLIRQVNSSPSSARNRGIAEANGELIALREADDLWTPDRLRLQLEVLAAQPQAGLVFGDSRRFSQEQPRP